MDTQVTSSLLKEVPVRGKWCSRPSAWWALDQIELNLDCIRREVYRLETARFRSLIAKSCRSVSEPNVVRCSSLVFEEQADATEANYAQP